MNREKLLTILVIALVALNVILLSVFLFEKDGPPRRQGPPDGGNRSGALEMFDFSDEQAKGFEESREQIKIKMRVLQTELTALSTEYYLESVNPSSVSKDSLLQEINKINVQIYSAHAIHFNEIKELCNPEQVKKLEVFIQDLISRPKGNGPNGGRKGPPSR